MKLILLFLVLPQALLAQTGTLTGTVRDTQQRPVPFASIVLPAAGLGATADAAGAFRVAEVPAGTLRAVVSAVGYANATRDENLSEGQTLNV